MTTPPPAAAPMSPGTYLRKRREAAGISLDLAALAFVPFPLPTMGRQERPEIRLATDNVISNLGLIEIVRTISGTLATLEADERQVGREVTECLAIVLPIDVEIYDRLVALSHGLDVALPQMCHECGCSLNAPCNSRVESGIPGCFAEHYCAWSGTDPNLCTACERKAAAQQQEHADAS